LDTRQIHQGAVIHPLASDIPLLGLLTNFNRGEAICSEGDPAKYVYKVVDGVVGTCKRLSYGRRQILGFHFPGEIVGLHLRPNYCYSAETIQKATVIAFSRVALSELTERNQAAAYQVWVLTARELQRQQDHSQSTFLMKSAQERVATFLLQMAARNPSELSVDLPMSRQDIADYLCLTVETVSRTITELQRAGAIVLLSSRRIVVRNRSLLNGTNVSGVPFRLN
jgi:CRP/FNR family nitrogen fixation transcriptional regulator